MMRSKGKFYVNSFVRVIQYFECEMFHKHRLHCLRIICKMCSNLPFEFKILEKYFLISFKRISVPTRLLATLFLLLLLTYLHLRDFLCSRFITLLYISTMTKHIWRNPLEKYLHKITCYHYWVYALLFTSKIPLIMHILNLIFLSPPMQFKCAGMEGVTAINYCPCKEPHWNTTVFKNTMQTKFSLLCDQSWKVQFGHSIAYTGQLCGCLIFGFLSDRFGRLNLFSLACFTIALFGGLVSIMPTISAFICMRFFEGFGVGGGIVTSYVLCIEYVGMHHRELITALFHVPLNIGHVFIPGVSYFLRDMDRFQLAVSVPLFFFAGSKWMIMESPKWLMDNDYVDEVVKGLQRMTTHTDEEILNDIELYKASLSRNQDQQKVQFWHIFRHKKIVINFSCMAFIYFVCGMGYYGVSQFIGSMGGNIHINVAISGAVLLPGTILCIFLLKAFSRRLFMLVTLFLSGVFMIIVAVIPKRFTWYTVPFACIGNCFFFMSFIIAFLYGVELFPTSVRNSVLGVLSVVSRIGQIMAPQINSLSHEIAGCIFGGLAIICSFLCLPLPETKNTELPSSLEETKRLSIRKSKDEELIPSPDATTSRGK